MKPLSATQDKFKDYSSKSPSLRDRLATDHWWQNLTAFATPTNGVRNLAAFPLHADSFWINPTIIIAIESR